MAHASLPFLAVALAACTTTWSSYDASLERALEDPVEHRQEHFEKLRTLLQLERAEGREPPPGLRVAYVYQGLRMGVPVPADALLAEEEAAYPRAAAFIAAFRRVMQVGEERAK